MPEPTGTSRRAFLRRAALAPILATFALGALAPGVAVDTSNESFLHPSSSSRLLYNEFRNQFGRDDVAIIVIRPPEIFDLRFLDKLRDLFD